MDFGDEDDDDWDANELEALEAQAVNNYAATQQRTQGQKSNHALHSRVDHAFEAYDIANDHELLAEKKRLEKLVQDKQGELLILKNNIARTNAEHNAALEHANATNKYIREELSKQLESYKDKVVRLETDVTFQRQELKEAKLRALQVGKTQSSPRASARYVSRLNGFPSKNDFEKDEFEPDLLSRLSPRKRRRTNRNDQEPALDDFDLAEERSRTRAAVLPTAKSQEDAAEQTMDVDSPSDQPTAQYGQPPILPREETNGSVFSDTSGIKTDWKGPVPDVLVVHSRVLNCVTHNGIGCIEALMQVPSTTEQHKGSIGQCLLLMLTTQASGNSSESLTLALSRFILDELAAQADDTHFLAALLALLDVFLQTFVEQVANLITSHESSGTTSIARLQDLAVRSMGPQEVSLRALYLLERTADGLDRAIEPCTKMLGELNTLFIRAILLGVHDNVMRIILVRCLAKLATHTETSDHCTDLLNPLTRHLDTDHKVDENLVVLRQTIVQYLYCIILYYKDGLDRLRKSRDVIPRLVRRLSRELDVLYDIRDRTQSMILIRMIVKIYHILLQDESNATNELHWRSPEIKAMHLTTMTRILYAEESDGFDSVTQDLAMELLEIAVSPEEGNDIYEVMGGIPSE
ncbi:protein of unknown function [Taphrina deformans PYCC 5710]|uniref:Rad26-like C-terminal domain-containing protein n=1 Tax=Taphrina deformans (strain PYCC 5710 / ATCC 11124 / CBS 356.35 / IMI 108563 / JCM 9778 / NBRC 8474) TaxID=1097556 RepID=R4XGS0_TAPDE|nr:protein of unknown function [Taphrina deformans PYCC 5710]|eukprot:CCG85087.1 protein of unknown function [Taphrina deformans PYCC 5710]